MTWRQVLAGALVVGVAVGCAPGSSKEASAPASGTSGGTQSPAPAEPETTQAAAPNLPNALRHRGLGLYGLTNTRELSYQMTQGGGTPTTGTQTVKFEGIKDGKATFRIERSGWLQNQSDVVEAREDGIYVLSSTMGTFDVPALELPSNPELGKTWQVKSKMTAGDMSPILEAVAKIEKEETIKVKAGEFPALKVNLTGSITLGERKIKLAGNTWYSDGIGMIKQQLTNEEGGNKQTIVVELLEIQDQPSTESSTKQ